jgi:rare lipoprotein A
VIKADSQPAAASSGSLRPTGLGKKGFGGAHLCALAVAFVLVGCSGSDKFGTVDPRYGVSSSARLVAPGEPVPKGGGVYRIGAPYSIGGRSFVPAEDPHYRAEGLASWYGEDFHGRQTANGEIYDMNSISAAHTTLPMPSHVRVTNLSNNRSVIVRVNDRGPYHSDRIIDVSVKAAILLGFYGSGLAPVRVEYVGAAPLEGSNDNILIATLRQGEPAPAPSLIRVASTKPFVPELALRNPSRDVPMPPSRPYSLGEGQVVSNYQPGSGVSSFTRPPAADPDNPAIAKVVATPMRPAFSANAPAQSEMQSGNLPLRALMPATDVRDLY